ncbi:MAG TPA: coproporphyrinogen III oxidase, partial [Chitinophagaceae bacterium]
IDGLSLTRVAKVWNSETAESIRKASGKFIEGGEMKTVQENLVLTSKGKLFADGIAAHLFR